MSRPPPKVTCLFFNDLTVASFLNTATGRTLAGDLLVECGLRPALGFPLNVETPVNYPGVAGLLGGVDIGTLAHPSDRLPAPILLAAGAPVSLDAVRGALALFRRVDDRLEAVTLLAPVSLARDLGAALAVADRFVIAWDVAAFPHASLLDFAQWLVSEKLLTVENFAGLFPYAGTSVDRAHAQRLALLLGPCAARSPAFRTEITTCRAG